MRRSPAALLMGTLCALAVVGCQEAPFTQRPQFILIGEQEELQLGEAAYRQVIEKETVVANTAQAERVRRVAMRIAAVADRYLASWGRAPFQWEVNVVASDKKNAFVLPGGKMVVYTGILQVTQNDAQLAAVLGHEAAHAVQRHGAERVSQGLVAQIGAAAVAKAMERKDASARTAVLGAYGLGATIGVLNPYSREHEKEADYVGLLLMAEAGYDPREALRFWERFAAQEQRGMPEFLSTHPADATRIALLKQALPNAEARYQAAPVHYGSGDPF